MCDTQFCATFTHGSMGDDVKTDRNPSSGRQSRCVVLYSLVKASFYLLSQESIQVKTCFVKEPIGDKRQMVLSGMPVWRKRWISRRRHSQYSGDHEESSASLPFSMPLKPSLRKWDTTRPRPIILQPGTGSRPPLCINSFPIRRRLSRLLLLGTLRNSRGCMIQCFPLKPHLFPFLSGSIRFLTDWLRFTLLIQLSYYFSREARHFRNSHLLLMLCRKRYKSALR